MTLSWLPTYIMRLLYLPNKVNTGPDLTYKKSALFFANSFGAFCWKVHPIVVAIKNNLRKIFINILFIGTGLGSSAPPRPSLVLVVSLIIYHLFVRVDRLVSL